MKLPGILFALASGSALLGQATLPTEFDVATIRLRTDISEVSRVNLRPGGRLEASNVTLNRIIAGAFDVTEQQIVDGPSWRSEDRWDVEAKAEGLPANAGPDLILPLLRKLLADRFQLRVRREMRQMPVYQLVVDRGGPSPRLQLSTTEGLGSTDIITGPKGLKLDAKRIGMVRLSQALSRRIGRAVVDRTGLTAVYDFTLEWTPDMAAPAADTEPLGPSVFTAIRETLGLRLEAGRDMVEVLVVERAERPSDN